MAHESHNRNRRRSERVKTSREVIFSDYQAVGPLRKGIASDMSSTGICIRTNFPEKVGARLQIELQPEASGDSNDVAIFKGVIVHVTELPDGEYAMGIRFEKTSPTALRRSTQSPAAAQSTFAPKTPTPASKTPIPTKSEKPALKTESAPPPSRPSRAVQYQQIKRKRKLRPGHLAILIALAALLMYLLLTAFKRDLTVLAEKLTYAAQENREAIVEPRDDAASQSQRLLSREGRDALEEFATTRSLDWNVPKRLPLRTRFGALTESKRRDNTGGHGTDLEESSIDARGKSNGAIPEQSTIDFTGKRKHSGIALVADSSKPGQSAPGLLLARWNRDSDPVVSDLNSVTIDDRPIEIVVSLSSGRLRVWKGNELLRQYPVGFGRGEATPIGDFTIANKIHDPAWINRGIVIPAASPDNPLGESWMGLAGSDMPLSIGIHPTENGDSIGQPASRGCIRMRPADAEALFRICPVGTRISIRS